MKQLLLTTVLFCSVFSLTAQINIQVYDINDVLKAKPIDKLLFTVQYQTTFVNDTLSPDKQTEETMMLKIGSKSSVYYSYARFHMDSLIEADKAAGASQDIISEHLKQGNGYVNYQIYKNYPIGKITMLDQLAASRFRCEETAERPVWTLYPDTTTILSYICRKATCYFRGRKYEAWYTQEIPRSEGPWKLQGLPGLILKASDKQGHYTFTCSGIEKSRKEEMIQFSGSEYEPILPNDLQKAHKRYASDPIGYVTETSPGINVTVRGEDGQPFRPKNMPYNPIEK
ncbi:GLPGLI family protein [Parabacteroides faecis]|uniref:GLPGLI family protein n=1 Tax=Parabacteroides faecis TaxID=1217282 RepID=A0ABR6KV40_9BACT|nr:GLPGLI family protein [Parabacteroides faecis]MBB4624659.1 GLPGLI family protein [Parabacteroides faecis]